MRTVIAAAVATAVVLSGCGGGAAKDAKKTDTTTSTAAPTSAATKAKCASIASEVWDGGSFNWGTRRHGQGFCGVESEKVYDANKAKADCAGSVCNRENRGDVAACCKASRSTCGSNDCTCSYWLNLTYSDYTDTDLCGAGKVLDPAKKDVVCTGMLPKLNGKTQQECTDRDVTTCCKLKPNTFLAEEGVMLPALVGFVAGASVLGLGAALCNRRAVAPLEEPFVA